MGAAVIGSVARGDFNVWSDIDVLVVAHDLPPRYLDRAALLTSAPAPGVQAFAFTPKELAEAQARRDPRANERLESGVFLAGEWDVRALMRA